MKAILRLPPGTAELAKALADQAGAKLTANPGENTWTFEGKSMPDALKSFVFDGKERLFVLDVPFQARSAASHAGATWDANVKAHVYRGAALPLELHPYASADFSLERYHEEEANGESSKQFPGTGKITPRPHQKVAIETVLKAKKTGRCGVLIADDVGLGKTVEAVAAAKEMGSDIETVLVVAPLAVVAHWRQTIREVGDGGKRWVCMNYERVSKLFEATESVKNAKRKKTKNKRLAEKGDLAIPFDLVILDESHRLRNPTSLRSKMCARLVEQSTFAMWLSATAGQNPLELSYLAPLLAQVTGARASDLAEWEEWCIRQGIGVSRGNYGKWEWSGDPEDCEKIRRMLFEGKTPAGIRRRPEDIAGWPEINRVLLPMELDSDGRKLYDQAWTAFRRDMQLAQKGNDPKVGIVAQLRFRQKSSLLRVPSTVELAEELLDNGRRVAISVQFRETMQELKTRLEKKGHTCSLIYGDQSGAEKEAEIGRFQTGKAVVAIHTVTEGINLQENEHDPTPRAAILHDAFFSAISASQAEGRTHRDGKKSTVYYVFAEDTVEEKIVHTVVERMIAMKSMQGDTTDTLKEIEAMLTSAAIA